VNPLLVCLESHVDQRGKEPGLNGRILRAGCHKPLPATSRGVFQVCQCAAPSFEPFSSGCAGVAFLRRNNGSFSSDLPSGHRRPDRSLGHPHRRLRRRRRHLGARWILGRRILLLMPALAAWHRRFRFRRRRAREGRTKTLMYGNRQFRNEEQTAKKDPWMRRTRNFVGVDAVSLEVSEGRKQGCRLQRRLQWAGEDG
jgi:hypothetical protein